MMSSFRDRVRSRSSGWLGGLMGALACVTFFLPAKSQAGLFATVSCGTILNPSAGQPPFMPGASLGLGSAYFRLHAGYRYATYAQTSFFDGALEMLPIPIGNGISRFGLFVQGDAGQAHSYGGQPPFFVGGGLMFSLLQGSLEQAQGCPAGLQCAQYYYGINLKLGAVGGQTGVSGGPSKFKGALFLVELPLGMNP